MIDTDGEAASCVAIVIGFVILLVAAGAGFLVAGLGGLLIGGGLGVLVGSAATVVARYWLGLFIEGEGKKPSEPESE